MGTYINCRVKDSKDIDTVNEMWNDFFPDYKYLFYLMSQKDMEVWLQEIHKNPNLSHLQYIKAIKKLDEVFPLNGLGTFQVKITGGDYLCSAMAKRYLLFFDNESVLPYLVSNPLDSEDVREIVTEIAQGKHRAEDCFVECPYCT